MKFDLLFKSSVIRELDDKYKLVVRHLLVEEEQVELAYSHVRDKVWFTIKFHKNLDIKKIGKYLSEKIL